MIPKLVNLCTSMDVGVGRRADTIEFQPSAFLAFFEHRPLTPKLWCIISLRFEGRTRVSSVSLLPGSRSLAVKHFFHQS